jgi:hypothetical protein
MFFSKFTFIIPIFIQTIQPLLMKLSLLTLLLFFSVSSIAQIVNIPDANFKAYLVGDALINTNADNEIQVSEATAYNGYFYCSQRNISDLTGIEYFTSLTRLYCRNNQLTSLDVSQNIELRYLFIEFNQLITLDVSQNVNLESFTCFNNQLECVNIKNGNNQYMEVSTLNNPNLTCLEVDDVNGPNIGFWSIDPSTTLSEDCYNACLATVGLKELSKSSKQLIKIVNLMGRVTDFKPNTPLLYIYSDGTTEKVYEVE